MKKYVWILATGALAAVVWAQSSGSQVLGGFVSALQGAGGLKANFAVIPDGGAPENYTMSLGKPNMVRIDSSSHLVVADGKTVTVLDKKSNTYTRDPQEAGAELSLLDPEGLSLWRPFFDAKALGSVTSKSLGTKNRKGMQLQVIEATFSGGRRKVTYYIGPDSLARQAEVAYHDTGDKRTIIDAKSIEVLGSISSGEFAFNPPAGSRELTPEERASDKWYENLDEALADAKKTKRLVLIDFSAVW